MPVTKSIRYCFIWSTLKRMLLTAWASWTRNVGGECRQNLNFWFHGVPLGDSCLQWLHYSWKQIIQSTKCYPVRLGNLQRISNRTISLSNTFNWILSQKCSTIKIRIFCKNDLLLEKNRPVNSFRIYNWAAHVLRRENKFNIMNHVEYNGPHRAFIWAILGGVSIFLRRHCNRFSR